MLKQSTWNLADTNLALYGSDIEKQHHHDEGAKEAAWADPSTGIGKQTGTWVWRIEKFHVVPWPKKKYGTFFSGDSYIILGSYKKKGSDVLLHNIHFWLGSETSQDEAGTAAYKTVELDDFLDGKPTQYREVEGNESALFHSYFPHMITLSGGIDSGFHHWKLETHHNRLLHVRKPAHLKGNHKVPIVIREVPMSFESLNSGDVFILDAGIKVFQFQGKDSSGIERVKAAEYVQGLLEERDGKAKVTVVDQGDRMMSFFWEALGSRGDIKPAQAGDEEEKKTPIFEKKLFKLSNESGKLQFAQVATGQINKNMFDSNDTFVFDVGQEVFVWIGHAANKEEKMSGLHYAQEYLKHQDRPPYTPISMVFQESESFAFQDRLDG